MCRKTHLGTSLNRDVYIRGVVSEQQSTKSEAQLYG
jgi:hypothetical protein